MAPKRPRRGVFVPGASLRAGGTNFVGVRSICCLLALLFLPLPGLAHDEVLRTDLRAIDAELVAVGQVVQVETDRGSRGPRLVSKSSSSGRSKGRRMPRP